MDAIELYESFQNLEVGDIFHGTYLGAGGGTGSAICLVTSMNAKTIKARTVTTHMQLVFDRETLANISSEDQKSVVTVTSTKRLPEDIHRVMLEIDWKFDPSNPVKDPKLTPAQRDALIFAAKQYEMYGKK